MLGKLIDMAIKATAQVGGAGVVELAKGAACTMDLASVSIGATAKVAASAAAEGVATANALTGGMIDLSAASFSSGLVEGGMKTLDMTDKLTTGGQVKTKLTQGGGGGNPFSGQQQHAMSASLPSVPTSSN